jgi:23S rRNA (uridine2552-2'-O)-methyltransferase
MVRRSGSKRWLQQQSKDLYVKKAQQSHYRTRAVYKLIEIDQKAQLISQGQTVVDLGAAPGSWSQYVSEQVGAQGKVIAIDILPIKPIDNVLFLKGDFTEQTVYDQCLKLLQGRNVDLVISDMAPNLSGIKSRDQARSMMLAELTSEFACKVLKPGGSMLTKVFQGEGVDIFRKDLKQHFQKIVTRKPAASRGHSREFYVLARTFAL